MNTLHTYLDEKSFSVNAFLQFLKENIALVVVSTLTIILVYNAKLTNICFGVDTELRISSNGYLNWLQIGRFGLVGLQKLWVNFLPSKELFNPYLAVMLGCIFLFLATLIWCFLIEIFADGLIKKTIYIPFAVVFISHQVWCEQIYFVLQSAECLFIVLLSPMAVYSFFTGVTKSDFKQIIFGSLLTVLCTSVYQGVLILIFCGIFAVFVMFYENTKLEKKEYSRLCITLLILMFASAATYFILNKIVQIGLHVEKSDYLSKMIGNDRNSVVWAILNIGVYIYKLVFAHFSPITHIAEPIMARTARTGWTAVEQIRGSSLMSNILLVPFGIAYVVFVLKEKKKSFFYVTVALCVLLTCFALVIVGGGDAPLRSQYVLPFAIAFIMMYVVSKLHKKTFILAFTLFSLVGVKQSLVCSMLNYSDVMRYEADVRLSAEIAERINEVSTNNEIPVFLYGVHHPLFSSNYVKGEVCAYSPFEWDNGASIRDTTSRGIGFMKTQGYNLTAVALDDTALIEKSRNCAKSMPDFPAKESVKNLGDVIIVRLSESSYNPQKDSK